MKGKKLKKVVSALLAVLLVAGLWQPMGAAQAQETEPQAAEEAHQAPQPQAAQDGLLAGTELLAHYEFQDGGKDSSGNNNHAVIGSGVTVKDGVASLPGGTANGSAFITLP